LPGGLGFDEVEGHQGGAPRLIARATTLRPLLTFCLGVFLLALLGGDLAADALAGEDVALVYPLLVGGLGEHPERASLLFLLEDRPPEGDVGEDDLAGGNGVSFGGVFLFGTVR